MTSDCQILNYLFLFKFILFNVNFHSYKLVTEVLKMKYLFNKYFIILFLLKTNALSCSLMANWALCVTVNYYL